MTLNYKNTKFNRVNNMKINVLFVIIILCQRVFVNKLRIPRMFSTFDENFVFPKGIYFNLQPIFFCYISYLFAFENFELFFPYTLQKMGEKQRKGQKIEERKIKKFFQKKWKLNLFSNHPEFMNIRQCSIIQILIRERTLFEVCWTHFTRVLLYIQ